MAIFETEERPPDRDKCGRVLDPPSTDNPIIHELFTLAAKDGWRLTELAKVLGTSRSLLFSYRQGQVEPNARRLEQLARVLGYRLKLERIVT